MKRRRRIIVTVAILGVLGQCLYPPWTVSATHPAAALSTVWVSGIYRPLFAPPGQRWLEQNGESRCGLNYPSQYTVNALIDWGRLSIGILGWLALVSLVAVMVGLHGRTGAKSPEEKRPKFGAQDT